MASGGLSSTRVVKSTNGAQAPQDLANGLNQTDRYGFIMEANGKDSGTFPVELIRQREHKWLEMLRIWDKWISKAFKKVKLRCRKGIPPSLRAMAWQHLSGSKYLLEQMPGKFEELDKVPAEPKWLEAIQKDLHRQFPFHELFHAQGGQGQQDLFRVLKAYTVFRPEEGYCQGQAPVAAVLLMHMPAEQAFWCFVQICERYLPGYYSIGLEALQLDGEILFALLRRSSPMAYRHLKKNGVDPVLYMTEWFMCIFARTLPWDSVLRVWDMFFCEGVKVMFRVALVLLRHALGTSEKVKSCPGLYETMEKLRSLPHNELHEHYLVKAILELDVSENDIEKEHTRQLHRWVELHGEPQHASDRRLHGAQAIRLELEMQREALRLARRARHKETTGHSPPPSPTPSVTSVTSTLSTLSTMSTMSQRRGGFGHRERELNRLLRQREKEAQKERKRLRKDLKLTKAQDVPKTEKTQVKRDPEAGYGKMKVTALKVPPNMKPHVPNGPELHQSKSGMDMPQGDTKVSLLNTPRSVLWDNVENNRFDSTKAVSKAISPSQDQSKVVSSAFRPLGAPGNAIQEKEQMLAPSIHTVGSLEDFVDTSLSGAVDGHALSRSNIEAELGPVEETYL
uniref:TBC1 domain family member 10A isoform X2 n=1 Tax=Myxine glutinosa TaxID=7769 RepID=UPI00358F2DBD